MVISKFLAGFFFSSSSSCHIARKCFSQHQVCQTNGGGEMRYPAQSKRKGARYESLSNALSEFEGNDSDHATKCT